MIRNSYDRSVFINCPMDYGYRQLFRATVFTIIRCNFNARCAEEESDASEIRLNKIFRMIEECKFGLHDLSMARLDKDTRLARFNMPLELGIFLAAKRFGRGQQDRKNCIVFEDRRHSYEKFISDIKGQDIATHESKPENLIKEIRNWLHTNSKAGPLPGGTAVWNEYRRFSGWLPRKCRMEHLRVSELTFHDYCALVYEWIDIHSNELKGG